MQVKPFKSLSIGKIVILIWNDRKQWDVCSCQIKWSEVPMCFYRVPVISSCNKNNFLLNSLARHSLRRSKPQKVKILESTTKKLQGTHREPFNRCKSVSFMKTLSTFRKHVCRESITRSLLSSAKRFCNLNLTFEKVTTGRSASSLTFMNR